MMKLLDLGVDATDVRNAMNFPLYQGVKVTWSKPSDLPRRGRIQIREAFLKDGHLYAITRNHGNSLRKDSILYVGITSNLKQRFQNHPKIDAIRELRGTTSISIGKIDFRPYRVAAGQGNRQALEELEHIFVWTLWSDLWNEKKQYTLPGMGKNGGQAWDITNEGYRFSGRMPKRIVYPWIIIDPRRDRTAKR